LVEVIEFTQYKVQYSLHSLCSDTHSHSLEITRVRLCERVNNTTENFSLTLMLFPSNFEGVIPLESNTKVHCGTPLFSESKLAVPLLIPYIRTLIKLGHSIDRYLSKICKYRCKTILHSKVMLGA
jgi:hypothetical protein